MYLDEGGHTGVYLTDLSKTYDCLDHDLLIAKLINSNTYGVDRRSLSFSCFQLKTDKIKDQS